MAGGDKPAFAGALCLKIEFCNLLVELPYQIILKGCLLPGRIKEIRWISRLLVRNEDTQFGRGSKGVPLHMVNGQDIVAEVIGSPGILVGRIASPVNGF